jgi:hypothetical protein
VEVTDEQADELYRGVVSVLREAEIGWIVDEAESAIRIGKLEATEVELETPLKQDQSRRRRRETGTRHTQRDWTPEERLAILLDAIDDAVCKPVSMESDLATVLPELDGHEIVFAPGGFSEDLAKERSRERLLELAATVTDAFAYKPPSPYTLRVDASRRDRQAMAGKLIALLQGVRRELNVNLD